MTACSLGAEISEDRSRCSVVKAWRDPGCPVTVQWTGVEARKAVGLLAGLYVADEPVAVVVDPQSQAGTLLAPLHEAGVLVRRMSTQDVAVAHGEFMDLVNAGGLWHLDQREMTDAVRSAQQRPLAGARALERRLPVDQAPIVAAELAVFGLLRWEELSTPGAWLV